MTAVDVEDVSWTVDDRTIVNRVALSIAPNEFVGIVGPNGSGKSSLLRMIYRVLRPTGLDTIYLFSDGLPNIGPGLTPAQAAMVPPLEETRQAEIMGRYIREKLRSTWNPCAANRIRVSGTNSVT